MTPEELERRAYADGDVERAKLLAQVVDGDAATTERNDWLEEENTRLDHLLTGALDLLQDIRDELEDESDVYDGPDGTPRPNTANRLLSLFSDRIDAALNP